MRSRIYRVLLLAVVVLALGASEAQATTIIEPPGSHFPYQRWADEAKVPTPEVTVTVSEETSECPEGAQSCTAEGAFTIWIAPTPLDGGGWQMERKAFLHELGHNFDFYVMPQWARERFEQVIGDYRPWDLESMTAPREKFAEAYMWCALTPRIKRAPTEWMYYRPTPKTQTAICNLIRRVGGWPLIRSHNR